MKNRYILISSLVALLLVLPIAFAIPQFPHRFCGDVTINGIEAPDGTLISAEIIGKTVITNNQNPVETLNGNYGKDGLALLVQGENLQGSTIRFYVNDVFADETFSPFEYGGGTDCVNLDVGKQELGAICSVNEHCLSNTCTDSVCVSAPTTGGTSPGSSSPSGGSTTSGTTTEPKEEEEEPTHDLITKTNLEQGYLGGFKEGKGIFFEVENKKHTLTVTDVTNNTANITVQSNPKSKILTIGEVWDVDVNDNGREDVSITLSSITNGNANIKIIEIPYEEEEPIVDKEPIFNDDALVDSTEKPAVDTSKSLVWLWIVLGIVIIGIVVFIIKKK